MTHTVTYNIIPVPHSQRFKIKMQIFSVQQLKQGQEFTLPVWTPGSYKKRDFSKNIVGTITATTYGEKALFEQIEPSKWRLNQDVDNLTLEYEIHANEISVRGLYLDQEHAFIEGAALFLEPKDLNDTEYFVNFIKPDSDLYKNWRCATTMQPYDTKTHQFGRYKAPNYTELIDHPIQMGELDIISFDVYGTPHDLVLSKNHGADKEKLAVELQKLCIEQMKFFNCEENKLFSRYMFLTTVLDTDGYGGLEHRSSCSLNISKDNLGTDIFLNLCSHEYFHLWNVKRVKPKEFMPYDLNKEVYTKLLWLSEGFTSYYSNVLLLKSELITAPIFLDNISKLISRLLATPGRKKQTLEQSSLEAWSKFYQTNSNSLNTMISYYTKGAVVGLILDLTIRSKTQGILSLNNLMQILWRDYGSKNIGVTTMDVQNIASGLCGENLTSLFDLLLRSTEDYDFVELFSKFGLDCQIGRPDGLEPPWLGIRADYKCSSLAVKSVYESGPAQVAGIIPSDTIVAIDGTKPSSNWQKDIAERSVAKPVTISYIRQRNGTLYDTKLELASQPASECKITEDPNASSDAKALRNGWLALRG